MASKFWNVYVTKTIINKVKTQVTDWEEWLATFIHGGLPHLSLSLLLFFFFCSALACLQLLWLVSEMLHLSPNPLEAQMTQISPPQRGLLRQTNPKKTRPPFTICLVTFLPFPQSTYSYQKAACLCIYSLVLWPH